MTGDLASILTALLREREGDGAQLFEAGLSRRDEQVNLVLDFLPVALLDHAGFIARPPAGWRVLLAFHGGRALRTVGEEIDEEESGA